MPMHLHCTCSRTRATMLVLPPGLGHIYNSCICKGIAPGPPSCWTGAVKRAEPCSAHCRR